MRAARDPVVLGLLGLVGLACDAGPAVAPSGVVVRDSAGVTIVESASPLWEEGEGWTLAPEPEVAIGRVEGDERYLLDGVVGVRRFADGRIAVLERGGSRVRVYDGDGRHLFDAGGPGEGPAELSSPQFLDLVGDTIVVYEYAPPTLTRFDGSGGFVRSTPLARQAAGAPRFETAFGLSERGDVVVGAWAPRPDYRPGREREVMTLWRLDGNGSGADSLARIRSDEIVVHDTGGWNQLTFGKTTYVTASDDRVWVAPSDDWSIRVLDLEGRLLRVVRRAVEPREVSPDDVRRWAAQIVRVLQQPPERVDAVVRRAEEIGVADVMPAYRMVAVDGGGNLWVEEWDDVGVDQGAFSVFRPDGAWLGTVDLPPGLPFDRAVGLSTAPLAIGEDHLLGVWVDELGVEQVRLYRIEKAPGRR